MLFNSYEFIFLFLPIAAVVYFILEKRNALAAASWLALVSLFFYGWWNPAYVPLLVGSIVVNYSIGRAIVAARTRNRSRRFAIVGIAFNLILLSYFKYTGFLLQAADDLLGLGLRIPEIVLPLGISFFTFTQIAFLADAHQGRAKEYNLAHYALFVTFFPHLIAGPILHHKEMMPQFARRRSYLFNPTNLAVGLTIFAVGLAKKTAIADSLAVFVAPVFSAAHRGTALGLVEAWGGALAYTLQLYFDFSGYSDMAIGLARIFGIKMPLNFFSPYKAVNIIDFWRRWHMTLSRFLRDYLYIPLGGNRKGRRRRYVNLMVTMVLGGLWHGAGWTFAVWGALHGVYLIVNHGWLAARQGFGFDRMDGPIGRAAARLITFFWVVVAWVCFRADTLASAGIVLKGMTGLAGVAPTQHLAHWDQGYTWVALGLALVWLFPNTQQIMARYAPSLPFDRTLEDASGGWLKICWRATVPWAYASSIVAVLGLLYLGRITEFLYFRF